MNKWAAQLKLGRAIKGLSLLVATYHPDFAVAETIFNRMYTQLPSFEFTSAGVQNELIEVAEISQNDTGHTIQDVRLWGMRAVQSTTFSDIATNRNFQCLLIRMERTTAVSFCQIRRRIGLADPLQVGGARKEDTLLLFPWLIELGIMSENCRPEDYEWQETVGETTFHFACRSDGTPVVYRHNSGVLGGLVVPEIEF